MNRVSLRKYDEQSDTLYTYDMNVDFDPNTIASNTHCTKVLTKNDKHSSHEIEGCVPIKGILYRTINPDAREARSKTMKLAVETYSEYLEKRAKIPESNYRWMYNILDGVAEKDSVVHRDDNFVLMNDYTWDKQYREQLHLLAIVTDRSLMSVRDIRRKHLPMMREIVDRCIQKIIELHGLQREDIKVFFHYPPSTYLLHIHLVHVARCDLKTSFEKCVEFWSMCRNIELDETYYQQDMQIINYS
ncbi:m7GpppX diphosphatase [Yasminevirus sp. GU-2018]|uniref:M7GpppX diphosphatase n=1 Tax=Yasminevirus sp. GU-2018 TaxID=2420051 RepID=A0A5K0U7R3_9VIRU|nr:m7GpppX diphosphatase [Yasminevirus sp. GU-2018]